MQPSKVLDDILRQAGSQTVNDREKFAAHRYYDGNQTTDEIQEYRDMHEMPDLTVNLVQENINAVLGQEEQRRVDWVVKADDDESQDIATALNTRLNESMRLIDANHHCSEAYRDGVINGDGWLYFGRNTDPLGHQYDLETINFREILYDRRHRRRDLRDCRYIARRRYLDDDAAIALFPKHKKLIEQTFSAWDQWEILPGGSYQDSGFADESFDSPYADQLYLNDGIKMIGVYDVYYRSYEERVLLVRPDGRREQFDGENPEHLAAVLSREAYQVRSHMSVMKNAWFIGDKMVSDEDSPHPHNEFPYIKVTGYTEDTTHYTYGLVRNMIGPQDAYNNANVRIHHLLNSRQIIVEKGAFSDADGGKSMDEIIHEANRQDGFFEINKNYKFEIKTNWGEINKLEDIKLAAREEMKAASGISYSFAGRDVEQKSGVAIASLAEMSATTLAELNSNYQFSRQRLGMLVMAHVIDDIGLDETEVGVVNDMGQLAKRIKLNERTGEGINNNLMMARTQVVLADASSSDGHRAQNQQQMMQIYQVSPPDVQQKLINYIIAESPMAKRHEFLEDLNRERGIGGTEEERQQIAEQQSELAERERKLVEREQQAEIALKEAQAEKVSMEAAAIAHDIGLGPEGERPDAANDDTAAKLAQVTDIRRAMAGRQLEQVG